MQIDARLVRQGAQFFADGFGHRRKIVARRISRKGAKAQRNLNKKTKLGAFHLRQMLGFVLTGIAIVFCEFILLFIPILGWLCILALWVSMLVLWILGLVAAINGEMKSMPVVGPLYQKWFGNTFD
jgi:uncharacterized membrane protein